MECADDGDLAPAVSVRMTVGFLLEQQNGNIKICSAVLSKAQVDLHLINPQQVLHFTLHDSNRLQATFVYSKISTDGTSILQSSVPCTHGSFIYTLHFVLIVVLIAVDIVPITQNFRLQTVISKPIPWLSIVICYELQLLDEHLSWWMLCHGLYRILQRI